MKKSALIALVLIIAACSSDPEPKVYTDIVGTWTFTGPGVSGTFEIAQFDGTLVVYEENSTFKLNGANHTATIRSRISPVSNPIGAYDNITLIDNSIPTETVTLRFSGPLSNKDYTELKCPGYTIRIGNGTQSLDRTNENTPIFIKRKS